MALTFPPAPFLSHAAGAEGGGWQFSPSCWLRSAFTRGAEGGGWRCSPSCWLRSAFTRGAEGGGWWPSPSPQPPSSPTLRERKGEGGGAHLHAGSVPLSHGERKGEGGGAYLCAGSVPLSHGERKGENGAGAKACWNTSRDGCTGIVFHASAKRHRIHQGRYHFGYSLASSSDC